MKKTLIVIAAATLLPVAALAGEGKDKSGTMGNTTWETLDANRDGRISQAEAASDTTIAFTSADRDGDGYLDKKEFRDHQKSSGGTTPQPQSMPDSAAVPEPATSEPAPDTETPRQ